MTRDEFLDKTGREPVDDDLERVNCEYAGYPNHLGCGWCEGHSAPMFQCCCRARNAMLVIREGHS
jgi:hypothetical protein